MKLPDRVAEVISALQWQFQRGPIPPGLRSYTREPWLVANDRLKAHGWRPKVTNEQAYVEGTESRWWTMITPKRRQELALAGMGVGAAALGWLGVQPVPPMAPPSPLVVAVGPTVDAGAVALDGGAVVGAAVVGGAVTVVGGAVVLVVVVLVVVVVGVVVVVVAVSGVVVLVAGNAVVEVAGLAGTVSTGSIQRASGSPVARPRSRPPSSRTGVASATSTLASSPICTATGSSSPSSTTVSSPDGSADDTSKESGSIPSGSDTTVTSSVVRSMETCTTSPLASCTWTRWPRAPTSAAAVVTPHPSSPIGVTIGRRSVVDAGAARSPSAVELAAMGDADRRGVIVIASAPTRRRPRVAVEAIRTRPLRVVGSCAGGPSSDG